MFGIAEQRKPDYIYHLVRLTSKMGNPLSE